jgi:photosystem II stability/assembly factor-like uncharacterized protein
LRHQTFPHLLAILVTWLALAPGIAQTPGESLLYQEDFQDGRASGWDLNTGWEVVQDGDNYVLAGQGHAWANPPTQNAADFRLLLRVKLLRGRIHLVYRLTNASRYYIGLQQNGSDLNKQYFPDTFQEGLASNGAYHSPNAWHAIEIIGEGPGLSFWVDGQLEWEYQDPEPLTYGWFALETLENSFVYVDDIQAFGASSGGASPIGAGLSEDGPAWVRTGGPLGGLGYDVRMRPDNPDVLYVTDAYAGVFMSTDGGLSWFPSNDGIDTRVGTSRDSIPVFCLTIDPHNYDTIWIGTQNVRGIFKSMNGGRSWERMDNGVIEKDGITFRGITVDPRSSDIVYAAAELSSWVWNGEPSPGREFDMTGGVVYKTLDGGQNWFPVWRGENLARYIWIDPRNPDVIYISTGIFDREAANSNPKTGSAGGEGLLKSNDGGQTWTHANNGLGNLYVGTLFMHPQNPDILLAGTGNNQYYQANGVYLTRDGGASWQQTLDGDNITSVEFAVSNPQIAYAGSNAAIYRSQDGGQTWERVSGGEEGWGPPGVRAGFPIDFQVDPRDPDRLFANEYGGGNFLSLDGGRTWSVASAGYTGAQVRHVIVSPTSAHVYAAARSGLFASRDGGESWQGLNTPPAYSMEWYVAALDPADDDHLLAANNWNSVIFSSHDRGQSWRPVGQPLGEMKSWRAIAFAPSNPAMVYAGSSAFYSAGTFDDRLPAAGVYRSQDAGETWTPANDALSQDANVTDLAIQPENPSIVYAATGNHGLIKSLDGGMSWTALNQGLPAQPVVLAVEIHPHDPDLVFTGLAFGGLYRSTDGGQTWRPSMDGLNPEATVSSLLFDPTDPQVMYAADLFSGVYRSTDSGATWSPLNNGLRTRAVNKLAIMADGQHLYAATEGEGVFRLDLDGKPPNIPTPTPTRPPAVTPEALSEPTIEIEMPAATPQPTATRAEKPVGGNKLCGSALVLPFVFLGWFWFQRRISK